MLDYLKNEIFKEETINWLLEEDNPSVRYFTLRDILKSPENDAGLQKAREKIMTVGTVPVILSKQEDGGYWGSPDGFYHTRYKGTVWQLIILAELGADGEDERIKKAIEFIFEHSQDAASGGFAYSSSVKTGGGRHSEVIPCLTGNMVWSLIRLGKINDPCVKRGIKWITSYQRFDDGESAALTGWPYDRLKAACFGKHTCHMGAAKALKALSEIPKDLYNPDIIDTIERGAEYFLKHHIYKKSHNLSKVPKPGWLKLGFPLMYQTDILELLGVLLKLGYRDNRMQEAVDVLLSKQDNQGKWILENTFNDRFITNIEQKDKPGKWVTLNALRVLTRFYS
jgi:hypothetical protein